VEREASEAEASVTAIVITSLRATLRVDPGSIQINGRRVLYPPSPPPPPLPPAAPPAVLEAGGLVAVVVSSILVVVALAAIAVYMWLRRRGAITAWWKSPRTRYVACAL